MDKPGDTLETPLLHQDEEIQKTDEEVLVPPPSSSTQEAQQVEIIDNLNPPIVTVRPAYVEVNNADLSQLPPLISYFSFFKYGWAFGKWLLFVAAVNIVTAVVWDIVDVEYSIIMVGVHFCVLFLTSVWFYWAVNIVERDLKHLDALSRDREGEQDDEEETVGVREQSNEESRSEDNHFSLSYDNIYGRVSRHIDNFWLNSQRTTSSMEHQPPTPAVSSLVSFAYIMWAIFSAFSAHFGLIAVFYNIYESECKAKRNKLDCVEHYVGEATAITTDVITICSVLLTCGLFIIFRKGIAAGIVPLIYIPVAIISYMFDDDTFILILMTIGTIFLHILICCGDDSRTCNLPHWMNREMRIWTLYSFLTAFLIFYEVNDDSLLIFATVYIIVTAIILQHPVLNLIGIIIILGSILPMLILLLFGGKGEEFEPFVWFLCGFGLIGLSDFISKLKRNPYVMALYRTFVQIVMGSQRREHVL